MFIITIFVLAKKTRKLLNIQQWETPTDKTPWTSARPGRKAAEGGWDPLRTQAGSCQCPDGGGGGGRGDTRKSRLRNLSNQSNFYEELPEIH